MTTDPSSPSSPSPRQNPPSQAGPSSASSPSGASVSSGPAAPSDPPPSPSRPPIPPVPPLLSNPGAAGSDADTDRLAASSPSTPAAELLRIAASRPDLHPALATNPATYPDLIDWLRTSPDPAVQAALSQRTATQPEPTQTTPVQAEASTRTADATANPSTSTAPAPAAKTKRRAGLTRSTASADSGTNTGTTESPAPRTRRRPRMGIIAAILVAVLVLAGGAAIAVKKLHGGTGAQATSPASGWAGEWRQIWKLDAVAPDNHRDILGNENQFVVIDTDDSSSQTVDTVTSYDVSGDTLEKQWEITVNRTRNDYNSGSPRYWGNYIVDRTWLIDSKTGEYIPCPWPAQEYPTDFIGNYAVHCDAEDQCGAWGSDSPDHKLWTKKIPGTNDFMYSPQGRWSYSAYQGDQTIAQFAGKTLINLATGETYNINVNGDSSADRQVVVDDDTGEARPVESPGRAIALADGWVFNRDGNTVFASPTGQELETIDVSINGGDDRPFTGIADQPHATIEQYKSYLINGDTSWAGVVVTRRSSGNYKFTVAGSTLKSSDWDGEDLIVSSDRSLLIQEQYGSVLRTNTGEYIDAMWDVQNSRRIDLPKQYDHFYMVNLDLIVAQDYTGELVAYRPAGK